MSVRIAVSVTLLLLFCVQSVICDDSRISLIVPARHEDCVFVNLIKDESLRFSVYSDMAIALRMCNPGSAKNIIYKPSTTEFYSDEILSREGGDYKFCFYNRQVGLPNTVHFIYRNEQEASVRKRLIDRDRVDKMLSQDHRDQVSSDTWDTLSMRIAKQHTSFYMGNNTDARIKTNLIFIGICLEIIDTELQLHRWKIRRHMNLQERNRSKVMYFSLAITGVMIVAACAQLIAIKGFINGRFSFKVWSYK